MLASPNDLQPFCVEVDSNHAVLVTVTSMNKRGMFIHLNAHTVTASMTKLCFQLMESSTPGPPIHRVCRTLLKSNNSTSYLPLQISKRSIERLGSPLNDLKDTDAARASNLTIYTPRNLI